MSIGIIIALIKQAAGNLTELNTVEKNNLVSAINEVNSMVAGIETLLAEV